MVVKVPKGWKLVPINPTLAMKEAGRKACPLGGDIAHYVYSKMIDAAPEPQTETPYEIGQRLAREGRGLSDVWGAVDHDDQVEEALKGFMASVKTEE